ncbi:TPA: PcfJ domain-containing protein [Bacillus wiedmannii]|nr:PcfJ domain-containing protein [Bacillus wiedmannii]
MTDIIFKNPFRESIKIRSFEATTGDPVELVHCADCNQISKALIIEKGRHKHHCPICKKRIIKKFNEDGIYVSKVYSNIFKTEEKVIYSCGFTHYILKFDFEKRKMRKLSLFYEYNITHNLETKHTFLVRKSRKRKNNLFSNITFGCVPVQWKFIFEHMRYMQQDETFKQFVSDLLPPWFPEKQELKVNEFPLYLLYPQLMILPSRISTNRRFRHHLKKDRKKRKALKYLTYKQKDILHWATGFETTKAERKLIYAEPQLLFLQKILSCIKNVGIRLRVYKTLHDLSLKYKRIIKNEDSFVNTMFGKSNPNENIYFTVNDFYQFKENSPLSENEFANSLIHLFETQLKDLDQISHFHFFDIFEEISRLIDKIHQDYPDYEIPRISNFLELHDTLSKDFNKLEIPYKEIKYSAEEQKKLEYKEDGYVFELATSNHQLMDVGDSLNICVGSYSHEAIKKELYIILIRSEVENKISHCLEIVGKRKLQIVQAKGKYNSVPDDAINSLILSYCKTKKIHINTFDLTVEEKTYKNAI